VAAPTTLAQLIQHARLSAKVGAVDISALNQIVEHTPEDMTVTVQAGMNWLDFQDALAEKAQWIPVDPPLAQLWTVRDVLDHALSGPRRCGFGLVRDYALGLRVVNADGEIIRAGGKVVKNVAGYDLTRLYIGARGTLGIIVEATFKVLPVPEAQGFGEMRVTSLEHAENLLAGLSETQLQPAVLDLHNVPAAGIAPGMWIVIGFAGAREDVDAQVAEAASLGLSTPTNLDHEKRFWEAAPAGGVSTLSVLPSKLTETIARIKPRYFVARGANGILHFLGDPQPSESIDPAGLNARLRKIFDPAEKFS
jgi:FAD/FMN-containing dehydrogenase